MNKTSQLFSIFRIFSIFLTIVIISLAPWLHQNFGESVIFDNIFFHVLTGTDNLLGADDEIILSFVNQVILIPLEIALVFEFTFAVCEFKLPKAKKIVSLLGKRSNLLLIILVAIVCSGIKLGAAQYFYQRAAGKDYFSTVYTKPSLGLKHGFKKKNLIILYVESLEQTLTNKEIFGTNLIEPIDQLSGITIKEFTQAPGTGCTVAGMIASQCAIPFKAPPFTKKINRLKFFLPNAICLSNILASLGYEQYLFVGSDLRFARMDKFYENHGYRHLYGLREFTNAGMNPKLFNGWGKGLNDDTLLDEAFKYIIKAAKSNKPFNFVIATTDNHEPNGKASPRCHQSERNNGFMGAYQCSSRFVTDFIKKLQNSGVLKNTTLVIMGDHTFMAGSKQLKYFPKPRYVYFKILDPNFKKIPTRNIMTHFDVAPTILDLLNIRPNTYPKFGLGVSIFADASPLDYKKLFNAVTNQSILNPSNTYDSFWYPAGFYSVK